MEQKQYQMTKEGFSNLQEELEDLKVRGRQEIKEKIQVALSFGDLSENAEYDEARNDQAKLEARISELEAMIKSAEIVDNAAISKSSNKIRIGSNVEIGLLDDDGNVVRKFKYCLVNSNSFKNTTGEDIIASDDSPIAKALLGKKKGEIVKIEAPRGFVSYKILKIVKGE